MLSEVKSVVVPQVLSQFHDFITKDKTDQDLWVQCATKLSIPLTQKKQLPIYFDLRLSRCHSLTAGIVSDGCMYDK